LHTLAKVIGKSTAREIGSMKIDGREIAKLRDALREFDESQEKPNED